MYLLQKHALVSGLGPNFGQKCLPQDPGLDTMLRCPKMFQVNVLVLDQDACFRAPLCTAYILTFGSKDYGGGSFRPPKVLIYISQQGSIKLATYSSITPPYCLPWSRKLKLSPLKSLFSKSLVSPSGFLESCFHASKRG